MNENRLEELREENNLKSKNIAKHLDVHESKYSEWENNKIPIPTKRLIQLADFYEVNIDYILKLTDVKIICNDKTNINLIEIGNRLRKIRKDMNLSLRELADKLNTSFSPLGAYERGERLIQSDTLISLSKISNYSIDWILARNDKKFK